MHISRLRIANFRIFENTEIPLNPGLNLVVGENNSGKTALIDAIRYALDTNSSEWIRVQESDFRRGESKFSIQLKFVSITPQQARVFVEHLTHELSEDKTCRQSVLYVTLTAELTDQFTRGSRYIRTELRSGIDGSGPPIEREVRNYLAATYLRPLRDAEADLTASRGSRLSQVLHSSKALRDANNVIALLKTLIDANNAILQNEAIGQSLDQIRSQVKSITFSNNPLHPTIEIVGGTDIEKLSEAEKKRMCRSVLEKLQLLIHEEDRHQGLGYSNLLFIATELLLLEQERDDFPLLLVEEPEAHLHPQLQMKLLKAIREDFSSPGRPALQSILTSHSPNLASKAPLDSQIIMARGCAFPLRKSATLLEDDDYQFLEKFLDVTKSNLFFARAVLIVEGDAENILIPTIAEALGKPLENYGVSVVNVGSTAYARYAKIFQRSNPAIWLPIRVVCIRDLDLWPRRAERQGPEDKIGFKNSISKDVKGRGGNELRWLDRYTPETLKEYKDRLCDVAGQNVRVELSDEWTLEYCFARGPLWRLLYEAVNDGTDGVDDLPVDPEERAIFLYGLIETQSAKTEAAYRLMSLLRKLYIPEMPLPVSDETPEEAEAREQAYLDKVQESHSALRQSLPGYIIRAIDYVTETTEVPMELTVQKSQSNHEV
jgi:putative ATP-dependent endonuclease of the OLD family